MPKSSNYRYQETNWCPSCAFNSIRKDQICKLFKVPQWVFTTTETNQKSGLCVRVGERNLEFGRVIDNHKLIFNDRQTSEEVVGLAVAPR